MLNTVRRPNANSIRMNSTVYRPTANLDANTVRDLVPTYIGPTFFEPSAAIDYNSFHKWGKLENDFKFFVLKVELSSRLKHTILDTRDKTKKVM